MRASTRAGPRDWIEGRRLRAFDLAQQGWRQKAIAAALGVTPGAVSQWLKRARDGGGRAALRRKPHPGRQPKLSAAQRQQIPALLARRADAFGFLGAVWTTKRIATVIQETFGVRYHPAHISRLMRQLRQSSQLPEVRATQRDPTAVEDWYTKRWPALKKRRGSKDAPSSG
jgi:transposase